MDMEDDEGRMDRRRRYDVETFYTQAYSSVDVSQQRRSHATAVTLPYDTHRPGRLMLVGEPGVGKTTMVAAFADERFADPDFRWEDWITKPTLGMDMATFKVGFDDGYIMPINAFDAAGDERFVNCIPPLLIHSADVVLVVFDATKPSADRVRFWNGVVRAAGRGAHDDGRYILLVANKIDAVDVAARPGLADLGGSLIEELDLASFSMVSVKTRENLIELMADVACKIRRRREETYAREVADMTAATLPVIVVRDAKQTNVTVTSTCLSC